MKALEEELNLASIPAAAKPLKEVPVDKTGDIKDIDFDLARKNIKRLLINGEDALDGLLELAGQGEHPRAYEVAGQLIKTLVDANKDLLNIHKQKMELDPPVQNTIRENNTTVFIGSTNELQKTLKDLKEKANEDSNLKGLETS